MTPDITSTLVPVDFSSNSARALDYAHTLATKFGAALHLLHVCEVPSLTTGSMDAYAIAYTNWSQQLGDEAERELLKLVPRLDGVAVTTEVLFGNPPRAVVAAILAAFLSAPFGATPASAQAPAAQPGAEMRQHVTGAEVFRTYCATCHGPSGRGDGPLAGAMRQKPADLTEIAKRNGGEYPSDLVFRTIDGKTPVRGHGGPDMPVWGDAFARSRDGGDAATVKQRIDSLVEFLRTLQVKPVH